MRAAVIGAGFIGDFHAVMYAEHPQAELCAVCDVDEKRAEDMAQRYGARAYTGAQEMLAAEKPELVSVCLPTYMHREYVLMALDAGAHVLCEKPFALTMEDCRAMDEAAQKAGRVLMVGQMLRWWPEYVRIAQEVRALGRPHYVQARRLQHPMRVIWHMQPHQGGGALFDLLVHDVDYVCSLLGTDCEVVAANGSRGPQGSWRRIDAMLRWKDGCHARVEACNMMPEGYPFTAAFHAEYPEACVDYSFRAPINIQRGAPTKTELIVYKDGQVFAPELTPDAQSAAFREEIDAFIRGVQAGVSPLPAKESIGVMQVIHGIKALLER